MGFTTCGTLLSKLRKGDDVGWEDFYQTYSPLIALCGQDYGLSPVDIEELIQLTVLAVFNDTKFLYDPGKGRFRDYLRTIIRHKAIDLKRKNAKRMAESDLDGLDFPDPGNLMNQRWDDEWRKHLLREALAELKTSIEPKTYQAFELYALKEWSPNRVAKFLDISVNSVYTNKNRALVKLREIVKDMEEV